MSAMDNIILKINATDHDKHFSLEYIYTMLMCSKAA